MAQAPPLPPLLAVLLLCGLLLVGGCSRPDDLATRPDAAPREIARGKQLLEQYQCGACHAIPGVPAAASNFAPSLHRFGLRSYIAGHLPNGPDVLARWIVEPRALVPDTLMPPMGASPDDARAMAAYLLTLR